MNLKESIEFLKELQEELRTQETDCQAAPRFWVVGDYRMVPTMDGCHDEYYLSSPGEDYYGSLEDFFKILEEEDLINLEAKEEYEEINCEITAIEWINKHLDKNAELVPVMEEHFIHQNTMFLTKKEAQEHIKANSHHYSPKAHTYAMTAWRAPKVEKLLKILETFDWDSIEI